jgi:uncharacterized Zn finger protein
VLCAVSELSDVELSEVEATVGTRSFQRGRSYARANRVVTIEWDPDVNTLTGAVVGQGDNFPMRELIEKVLDLPDR